MIGHRSFNRFTGLPAASCRKSLEDESCSDRIMLTKWANPEPPQSSIPRPLGYARVSFANIRRTWLPGQ